MKRLALCALFLFAFASRAEFFNGPISKSVGGGGRAGLQSMEAAFMNPALVPLIKISDMAAYYEDGYSARAQHRTAYGLGFLDATEEVYFPAAAHYFRFRETGRGTPAAQGEFYHAAGGKNIGDWFAAGVSVYRLTHNVTGGDEYTQWNYSLGTLFLLPGEIGIAYVLSNLAKPGSEVPAGLRQDLTQAIGVYGSVANLMKLRVDVSRLERRNPEHKLVYSIGVETMTSEWLLFRMGFRRDEWSDQRVWSTGFGFNGPRLKVDYAFEKNAEGTSGAVHSVDMRVPF